VDLGIDGLDGASEIGRGGFGVVYKARQSALNRYVAVKVLPAIPDAAALARFHLEATATGSLSGHPNVVVVHGFGTTDHRQPYLVFEYLAQGSYADRLTNGPLSPMEATSVATEIGGVLESAHRCGLLHRDVKPENLLVGHFGEPKLSDFGIAQFAGATGDHLLSPVHAAPEAIDGRATSKSDVYSLASTLFELLAGSPPFLHAGDTSLLAMLARVATEPPPDLTALGVPEPIATAVAGGLAKDPADRPTARMFAKNLNQARRALGWDPVAIRIVHVAASLLAQEQPEPAEPAERPEPAPGQVDPTPPARVVPPLDPTVVLPVAGGPVLDGAVPKRPGGRLPPPMVDPTVVLTPDQSPAADAEPLDPTVVLDSPGAEPLDPTVVLDSPGAEPLDPTVVLDGSVPPKRPARSDRPVAADDGTRIVPRPDEPPR
jgi:hypothetical protein